MSQSTADPVLRHADASGQPAPGPQTKPRSWGREVLRRASIVFLPLMTFVALVGLWELVVVIFNVPAYTVPRPTALPQAFADNASTLLTATEHTVEESLVGFIVAAITAIPLALAITVVPVLRKTLYPLLVVMQAVPKIALGPLFVIWFGFGLIPKVALVYLLSFFPILVASATGFAVLDKRYLYLMQSMGATRLQTLFRLRLPEALPQIFGGLEVGIVISTTAALVAEFIGSNSGLGYLLLQGQGQLEIPLVFAVIIIISAMGVVFDAALLLLKWIIMPWERV